jgi:hypothetical protein
MADKRVQIRSEGRRGCGYRKQKGALYLVDLDPGNFKPCGKWPVSLAVCPCCGSGVKPSRQWVWVESDQLLAGARAKSCPMADDFGCNCPLDGEMKTGRAGLLWIGDRFYSPSEFNAEAGVMGISRRVNFIPRGFEIGTTWVYLAHAKGDGKGGPGTIAAFRPTAAEVLCDGTESTDEIDGYVARGLTPVIISNPDKLSADAEEEEL